MNSRQNFHERAERQSPALAQGIIWASSSRFANFQNFIKQLPEDLGSFAIDTSVRASLRPSSTPNRSLSLTKITVVMSSSLTPNVVGRLNSENEELPQPPR